MDQRKTGAFLKKLRNEKGLTQAELARQFNVTNRSVSRWETGSNLPDISILVEIADFYDVDVREIIDGEKKSENMDKELKDVADKMADYASSEKNRLLSFVQKAGIAGVILLLLSIIFQCITYEPDLRRAGGILVSFLALIIMGVITLYVTGVLQKIAGNKQTMKAVKIVTIVLLVIGAVRVLLFGLALGFVMLDVFLSEIEVQTDPASFNEYINGEDIDDMKPGWGSDEQFKVLPRTLEGLNVTEYQLTYYNPWDAQYVVYMTVEYDDADYEDEIERLEDIGIDDYIGIYTVTGEPDGYDLVAMDSDEYSGFVYAMIPDDTDQGNRAITYVGIFFCNYSLDLDIHEYIPDEYLLPGFDASDDNPYEQEQTAKRNNG